MDNTRYKPIQNDYKPKSGDMVVLEAPEGCSLGFTSGKTYIGTLCRDSLEMVKVVDDEGDRDSFYLGKYDGCLDGTWIVLGLHDKSGGVTLKTGFQWLWQELPGGSAALRRFRAIGPDDQYYLVSSWLTSHFAEWRITKADDTCIERVRGINIDDPEAAQIYAEGAIAKFIAQPQESNGQVHFNGEAYNLTPASQDHVFVRGDVVAVKVPVNYAINEERQPISHDTLYALTMSDKCFGNFTADNGREYYSYLRGTGWFNDGDWDILGLLEDV